MNVRRIPFPREHGAWAVLLAALLLAWAHPWARGWPAAVLGILFVLAFAIQAPIRALALGRAGRWGAWVFFYGTLLLGGAVYLVVGHSMHVLIPAAALGMLLTGADVIARRCNGNHRSVFVRIGGAASLTLVLPGMLCVLHPEHTAYAFVLWALMVVYFASRFPVVRMRIAARRGEATSWTPMIATQLLMYATVLALIVFARAHVALLGAVLPATLLSFNRGWSLKRTGWWEVAALTWFVTALILTYHIAPYSLAGVF